MKMPLFRILFFSSLLLPSFIYGQSSIIMGLNGTVEYRVGKEGAWSPATRGLQVHKGGEIRTGSGSRVLLLFKSGSKVWLKENTTLAIDEKGPNATDISLQRGSIKARVVKLGRRGSFRVRTLTSVASVRGTLFTASVDELGQGLTEVLFGEVKHDLLEPDTGKVIGSAIVSQGSGYGAGRLELLTKEQERSGLEDWSPGLSDQERQSDLVEREVRRNEVRQFVHQARSRENEVSSYRSQVKEEDFAAGRTLTDVHGNLVRVDQRLERPDGRTIQVSNIVKRGGYASGGLREFKYNGPDGPRFDSVHAKLEFNMDLPRAVNEMPGFFIANKDVVNVDRSELVLASATDPDSVFVIGFFGRRDQSPKKDGIEPDLYVGILGADGDSTARQKLRNLKLNDDGSISGLSRFKEDGSIPDVSSKDAPNGELYGHSSSRWKEYNNDANKLWLASENFVIDNSGRVRNVFDFIGGAANFETLLKDSAIESVVFLKKDKNNLPDPVTDAFNGRNVDLVLIPDLPVAIIKSLVSSINSFKNASK